MTCKDCIHCGICYKKIYTPDNGCKCDNFKDKNKIIELPCKVGDTVYCISHESEVMRGKVWQTEIDGRQENFIESPCKPGDTVYAILEENKGKYKIFKCTVEEVRLERDRTVILVKRDGWLIPTDIIDCVEWGKRVFATKEEAREEHRRRYE